jgi:hypothetical protein
VTYSFTASAPGTFTYSSGTQMPLEVEMGLVGAIIVRPRVTGTVRHDRAYPSATTRFEQEYLFLLSEIDPVIHAAVSFGDPVDLTARHATLWLINGRTFPDTMADDFAPWLPNQPYGSNPMMHPGDRVLMRLVGGGTDFHPFHTHGVNHLVIARDARVLKSPTGTGIELAYSDYTTTSVPGETVDAIWGPWTGFQLGWDVYGTAAINPHLAGRTGPGSTPRRTSGSRTTTSRSRSRSPRRATWSSARCTAARPTSASPATSRRPTSSRTPWAGSLSCGTRTASAS